MRRSPRRMAVLATAVAVTVLLWCCVAVDADDAPSSVSYQIHSYDDLREWPQVLAKSSLWSPDALYFKIDPHYMGDPGFCAGQPNVRHPAEDGCFVLNHNNPVGTRAYNSTGNVLALINDPANSKWFGVGAAKPVTIAWCFKVSLDPCDGSSAAQAFLRAYAALFQEMLAVHTSPDNSVSFILDGSVVPIENNACMRQFGNASAGIIPGTWGFGGGLHVPFEAAFSDNATLGYNRLSVFDVPVPTPPFDLMAAIGWGKFAEQEAFPLLVWEPSHQFEILDVARTYNTHGPHPPRGLRFAINIDPLQFELYAGPATGRTWLHPLLPDASPPWASVAHVAPVSGGLALCLAYANASASASAGPIYLACWASPGGSIPSPVSGLGLTLGPVLVPGTQGCRVLGISNAALDAKAQWTLWARCAGSGVVSVSASWGPALGTVSFSGNPVPVALPANMSWTDCFVAAVASDDAAMLGVACGATANEVMVLDTTTRSVLGSVTLGESGAVAPGDASRGSIIAVPTVPASASPPVVVVVVGSVSDKSVYAGALGGQAAPLGPGTSPRVLSQSGVGGHPVVVVFSDGYCWNSETHNKAATPATCEFTPTATADVLGYISIEPRAFVERVQTGAGPIGACSVGHVMAGAYGTGRVPTGSLIRSPSTNASVVVAMHQWVDATGPAFECGIANAQQGIGATLASWTAG